MADSYQKFFNIAGMSVAVSSDLPITGTTFDKRFDSFCIDNPGEDVITIHHHFYLPEFETYDFGNEVYRKAPWAIFDDNDKWVYGEILPHRPANQFNRLAVFNRQHTSAEIFHDPMMKKPYSEGGLSSLTFFPTDQILFSRILPERDGCYIHSSGMILDGKGYLFVGHSEAGKTTITRLLQNHAEVLCDDRNIIRKWPDGFYVHGTWSHGDIPDVSSAGAPVAGMMFIHQSRGNRIVPITSRREIMEKMLPCLIKPFVTADWWDKMLDLVEDIVRKVPCYDLYFDKSGKILDLIK